MAKSDKKIKFKYCGEIVDRSWFEDPEAYVEGTYTPMLVSVGFSSNLDFDDVEFFQAILKPNRIYLDEYPEQKKLRKKFLNSFLLFKNRFGQKSMILNGCSLFNVGKIKEKQLIELKRRLSSFATLGKISLKSIKDVFVSFKKFDNSLKQLKPINTMFDKSIEESVNKQILRGLGLTQKDLDNEPDPYEHFIKRFMRKE